MTEESAEAGEAEAVVAGLPREVSLATLLWLAVGTVFVALRLGVALNAPVAGTELTHLSGAWEASTGAAGSRFVPTLFQAISAVTFGATTSESLARIIALVATATIPLALYLLRKPLTEAGALLALVLLAFDAPGMLLGATASAMGFDLALTAWLAVLFVRRLEIGFGWLAAGALVGLSGPMTLPLLAARVCTANLRNETGESTLARLRPALRFTAGLVIAVGLASTRFGAGSDGLVVPPLDLFGSGFSERWLSSTLGDNLLLYGLPMLVLGVAALSLRAWDWLERGSRADGARLLLTWAAFALAWLIASLGNHNLAPLAAFALPAALLAGPMLARMTAALGQTNWRTARLILPAIAAFAGLIIAVVLDWAQREMAGAASEKFLVAAFALAIGVLLGVLLMNRRTAVIAALPPLALGGILLVTGAFPVASGAATEPLISPVSPNQARSLRDTAIALRAEKGGAIVIHPDLRDEATWPFRDSGTIIFASRLPQDARIVIWPLELPPPDGFEVLVGNWALTRDAPAPASSVLRGLHWYIDRHTLAISPRPVAVYTKASE